MVVVESEIDCTQGLNTVLTQREGVKIICCKITLHPSGMSIRLVSILSFLNTASSTSSFPTWNKKLLIIIEQHFN